MPLHVVQWDVNIFKYRRQKVCSSECHKTLAFTVFNWSLVLVNDDLMMFSLTDSNPVPAERARNTQCHQWHRLCSDQVGMHQLCRVFVAICFLFLPLQFSPRPCPLKTLHPTGFISADTRSCLDVDVQGLLDMSEDRM